MYCSTIDTIRIPYPGYGIRVTKFSTAIDPCVDLLNLVVVLECTWYTMHDQPIPGITSTRALGSPRAAGRNLLYPWEN